jgi:hypothetical protein
MNIIRTRIVIDRKKSVSDSVRTAGCRKGVASSPTLNVSINFKILNGLNYV